VRLFCLFFMIVIVMSPISILFAQDAKVLSELDEKMTKVISLDLRDMDVVDVYKFLALKGDLNVSINKNITGRVTLYLNNVSIRDALDIISIANNLAYKIVNNNIIYIMTDADFLGMYGKKFNDKTELKILYLKYAKPAYVLEALKNVKSELGKIVIDEDTGSVVMIDTPEAVTKMQEAIEQMDHPLETKIYNLQYANADDVANKLKEKLDNKAVGSVQADARSNQLVVRALPDRISEVEAIITALDKKTKAVLIDVRILKIILNPKFDAGINWDGVFKKIAGTSLNNLTVGGNFPVTSTVTSFGRIAVGDFSAADFGLDLRLRQEVSDTKVLANPRIMVVNNKEARIHIGDKLAYVTTTTIGTGESQRINEEIHYVDVGVQFRVTATINDDGFITMAITPEISSKAGELTTTQGAKVPLINSTLVETNVIVKDGQTIVIGGLRRDDFTRVDKGVPGLMDIPGIGVLFSSKSEEKTKTEIAILLTPHIVSESENDVSKRLEAQEKIKPFKEY
jgi:type II secretory pathway component GspD/PulD (secretin)